MLARKHRLSKSKDCKKILSKGRSFFSPSFRIKYLANNLENFRTTVVVSAKISKKAAVRNHLKRQVREILRLNLKQIKPGYDLLVSLNKQALQKDYQQLAKELLANLSRARLLK